MEYRKLGNSGLTVPILSLGTMNLGYPTDKETSLRIIAQALEAGINLIDTAVVYPMRPPFGVSEEIIGEAVKGKRDEVFIAAKVWPGRNSRLNIVREVEASLRRLQTDYLDLYQLHTPDQETPIEETLETLTNLIRQGKVRYLGCSNFSAWQMAESFLASERYNLARFISNQVPYNLLCRRIEEEVVPLCQAQGLGILGYSPLGGGFLTGKYKGKEEAPKASRYEEDATRCGYATAENMRLVQEFCRLAAEFGCSPSQLALAWAVRQPGISSVILGPRTEQHLEENLKAIDVELTDEQMESVSQLTDYTVQREGISWGGYRARQQQAIERLEGDST